jgi:chemotaxis protein MotB
MKLSNLWKSLGLLSLALVISSCVAREHHDDALAASKHWQKEFLQADKQRGELATENARLKEMLRVSEANPAEANYASDLDARLKDLRNVISQLGANPDDVTKFQVDGGYVYRMKDSILFALGSANVSAEGMKILEQVAADIESKPHGPVSVRGHTDNVPVSKPETKAKYPHGNLQLSAARAVEVAAALRTVTGSVVTDVVVMGYGESSPVQPNTSEANRKQNRRVEIFVADPVGR